jgi:hypothetical protein
MLIDAIIKSAFEIYPELVKFSSTELVDILNSKFFTSRKQNLFSHRDVCPSGTFISKLNRRFESKLTLGGIILIMYVTTWSRGSSGSIVSDYGLDDRAVGVRSPAEAKDFSSNLRVQTGSGAHPASCTMGTGGPFPGGKSAAGP